MPQSNENKSCMTEFMTVDWILLDKRAKILVLYLNQLVNCNSHQADHELTRALFLTFKIIITPSLLYMEAGKYIFQFKILTLSLPELNSSSRYQSLMYSGDQPDFVHASKFLKNK